MKESDLGTLARYCSEGLKAIGQWEDDNKNAQIAEATRMSVLIQKNRLDSATMTIGKWYLQLLDVRKTMREHMAAVRVYNRDPEHNEKPSLTGKSSSVYASIDDLSVLGKTMLWFTTVTPNDPDASAAAVEIWDDERNIELRKVLGEALEAKARIEKQTDSRTGYSKRRREVG